MYGHHKNKQTKETVVAGASQRVLMSSQDFSLVNNYVRFLSPQHPPRPLVSFVGLGVVFIASYPVPFPAIKS